MKIILKQNKRITMLVALLLQSGLEKVKTLYPPPKAEKKEVRNFENLVRRIGVYEVFRLVLFGKKNEEEILGILSNYEKNFNKDYKKIKRVEKNWYERKVKYKEYLTSLLREAERYTKRRFNKKVVVVPVYFLPDWGMSFWNKNIYVTLPVKSKRKGKRMMHRILHESLHHLINLKNKRAIQLLNKKYKKYKFKKEEREVYPTPVDVINEAFVRSVELRVLERMNIKDKRIRGNIKRISFGKETYERLTKEYEIDKYKFGDINSFINYWTRLMLTS